MHSDALLSMLCYVCSGVHKEKRLRNPGTLQNSDRTIALMLLNQLLNFSYNTYNP